MSLFSAISSSLTGLQAVTTQMQLVSNNITNASEDGYTRKQAVLQPISLGTDGGGTMISGYTRASDDILAASLRRATSNAQFVSTQDKYQQQVANVLGVTNGENPPLATAVSDLASAWAQFAAAPESSVQQNQLVQAAQKLVTQVQNTSSQVQALDKQVTDAINSTLTDINATLSGISSLNKEISATISSGLSPGNLQDQRDQLVQKLSGYMTVTVMPRSQGQIAVYTTNGYMLVDGNPQSFSYNGTDVVAANDATHSLNNVFVGGSLQAMVNFRANSSPASASVDPSTEVIRKLQSQLDCIVKAFTTSTAGPPESFAHAYQNATGTTGEATSMFTGTDRFTFAVNSSLINGTQTVKVASGNGVVATFNDATKNFTADGLSMVNGSYETLATRIVSGFQQAANAVSTQKTSAESQQSYLKQQMANETGVNVDTETVSLTMLQNAYAASAHVLAVVQQMFNALENIS